MIRILCVSAAIALFALCSHSNGEVAPEDLVHATKFLKRYGYMHPNSEGDSESMKEAMAAMQQFAGLEATGEINAETMEKMKAKRCSLPDMDASSGKAKRFVVIKKWSFLNHTYSIVNYPANRSACLTEGKINEYMNYTFTTWAKYLSGLKVDPAPAGKNGTIVIIFGSYVHGDNYGFDGIGDTLAHAFYPQSGKLHFDSSEFWGCFNESVNKNLAFTHLKEVALHEIGHILGLGHSEDNSAVMAPYYRGTVENPSLSQDDIDGIKTLYSIP